MSPYVSLSSSSSILLSLLKAISMYSGFSSASQRCMNSMKTLSHSCALSMPRMSVGSLDFGSKLSMMTVITTASAL